jgi:hypothetical protein
MKTTMVDIAPTKHPNRKVPYRVTQIEVKPYDEFIVHNMKDDKTYQVKLFDSSCTCPSNEKHPVDGTMYCKHLRECVYLYMKYMSERPVILHRY